mgnify:CR=1 FL=1
MKKVAIFKLIRPLNCVFAGIAVLIGALLGARVYNFAGWEVYLLAFLVAALVAGGGNAINDYFDRAIDRINRPYRPIPSGQIKPNTALRISQVFFIAGILSSVALKNPFCFAIAGINSLMLVFYAGKLKRLGLPGNLTIGYLVGSTFLFGGLATSPYGAGPLIPTELLVLVLMASFSTVGRELIKGIEDMPGDKKLKLRTFPLTHGARKAAGLATLFILLAIVLAPIPYTEHIFGEYYLYPLLVSIGAFLVAIGLILRNPAPKTAAWSSLACKIGMGFGLLAFLMGTLSA